MAKSRSTSPASPVGKHLTPEKPDRFAARGPAAGAHRANAPEQNSGEHEQDKSTPEEAGRDGGKEEWIGEQLRRVYDEALNEPVPDRLLQLLEQLKDKDPDAR